MKQKWAVPALLLAALVMAVPGWAAEQRDGNGKIGVIDIQRIMRDSKVVKKMRETFQKEVQAKKEILVAKEKEVKLLEEEMRGAASKQPPEAVKQKNEKLVKEAKELTRLRDDMTEELKRKNNELTRKVIGEIVAIAQNLAQKEHYAVILEKNAVVAAHASVDITDKMTALYDAGS